MPIVHVELIEGRSAEQKEGLIRDITAAVAKNADVPSERVHVILHDMKHGDYGVGGEIK